MGLLACRCALQRVQDFIALVDTGPRFLLARKADGVVEVTNDAPVTQMQLGCEMKFDRHGCITGAQAAGSG